jgi:hypothetical protein
MVDSGAKVSDNVHKMYGAAKQLADQLTNIRGNKVLQEEWKTAHDYISEFALDGQMDKEEVEARLATDFKKAFEDIGLFLPAGYLE